MSRGEVLLVAGILLLAIGVAMWIAPGAGVALFGIAVGALGVVEILDAGEAEGPDAGEAAS